MISVLTYPADLFEKSPDFLTEHLSEVKGWGDAQREDF